MVTVGIVYSQKDGTPWAAHIEGVVRVASSTYTVITDVQVFSFTTIRKNDVTCNQFFKDPNCITVIIGTPQLLDSINRTKKAHVLKATSDRQRVIFLCCPVTVQDVLDSELNGTKFDGFEEWAHITNYNDDSFLQAIVSRIELLQPQSASSQAQEPSQAEPQAQPQAVHALAGVPEEQARDAAEAAVDPSPSGRPPPPSVTPRRNSVHPQQVEGAAGSGGGGGGGLKKTRMPEPSKEQPQQAMPNTQLAKYLTTNHPRVLDFTVVPNVVNCAGKKTVMLTFNEALNEEEMECIFIEMSSVEQADNCFMIGNDRLTKHNPYTISVELDTHSECKMELRVIWNVKGKKNKLMGAMLGTQPFQYMPQMDSLECATILYLELLAVTLDALSKSPSVDMAAVDKRLNAVFSDERDDIPPMAFEQLFGMYQYYQDCGHIQQLNPTLLHLTARHGLMDLTTSLLGLNDHHLPLCMLNSAGKMPHELAEINKHTQLSEDIQASEMKDMYDLYSTMENYGSVGEARKKVNPNYYKRPFPVPIPVGEEPRSSPKDLLPNDYYMKMNQAVPPPPAAAAADDIDDQPSYIYAAEIVLSNATPPVAGELYEYGEFTNDTFQASAAPQPQPVKSESISKEEEQWAKVVEIMDKVKDEKCNIKDAAKMFDEWMKQNPELGQMRKRHLITQMIQVKKMAEHLESSKQKKRFGIGLLSGRSKSKADYSTTPRPARTPTKKTAQRPTPITHTSTSPNRDSTTSNSSSGSRDSTASVNSRDSGIDTPFAQTQGESCQPVLRQGRPKGSAADIDQALIKRVSRSISQSHPAPALPPRDPIPQASDDDENSSEDYEEFEDQPAPPPAASANATLGRPGRQTPAKPSVASKPKHHK